MSTVDAAAGESGHPAVTDQAPAAPAGTGGKALPLGKPLMH